LNASQTTETEEPEDIRTNEQYNLRPKPAHRPTINWWCQYTKDTRI